MTEHEKTRPLYGLARIQALVTLTAAVLSNPNHSSPDMVRYSGMTDAVDTARKVLAMIEAA